MDEKSNNSPPKIKENNGECSRSQEEGGRTFIEHVSIDRDLNEGFDQPGQEEDLWSNGRDETKMCDKIRSLRSNYYSPNDQTSVTCYLWVENTDVILSSSLG